MAVGESPFLTFVGFPTVLLFAKSKPATTMRRKSSPVAPLSLSADKDAAHKSEVVNRFSLSSRNRAKLVPDNRNWVKYICAHSSDPTKSSPSVILPDGTRTAVFSFGVVADVQYARLPTVRGVKTVKQNGTSVQVRRRRAWKEAPAKLEQALRAFDKAAVDFVVNLGDAIEGYGRREESRSIQDLGKVCGVFERAKSEVYHVVGNHCRRIHLVSLQEIFGMTKAHYTFCPTDGWRFVVLYSSELCGGAIDSTDQEEELLNEIVRREGRATHHFHGALRDEQLRWLGRQLDQAEEENERVVLLSHHPLADGSARSSHVLANTSQVREIVERNGTPVVLCLAGHDHMGK